MSMVIVNNLALNWYKHYIFCLQQEAKNWNKGEGNQWNQIFLHLPKGEFRLEIEGRRGDSSASGLLVDDVSIRPRADYCKSTAFMIYQGALSKFQTFQT